MRIQIYNSKTINSITNYLKLKFNIFKGKMSSTIYTHLVVINQNKEFQIAETVKIDCEANERITDLL